VSPITLCSKSRAAPMSHGPRVTILMAFKKKEASISRIQGYAGLG
jgi:hypothetical protein